ncbi:MAG: CoB--CoM heterodisulfide reductase subunit B [Candidatus Lokiarchaeota archaeon]|nr:CoB--CoM heterodisulfide reductase subunit B [Candidatus Lokiarchaeota archaeon]MBD3341179.1 CoB--CoM heterodisulfide reductase subunit B [Candidatus Lokiarchaeota archaeon]
MKEFAFFLGCTIPLKLPHLERAFRDVASILDVGLKEMEGVSCCPEPVALQSLSVETWLTLGARNLAIAENMGLDVLTICSGCYETLKTVSVLLEEDPEHREKINELLHKINYNYEGKIKVTHFVELFAQEEWLEKIKSLVVRPLDDLNLAVHYGCHLIRPSKIMQFDHPEKPEKIDAILQVLGAKTIDYATKLECCGYCARLQDEIGESLVEEKMTELCEMDQSVDALIAVCPACVTQYDRKEKIISREKDKELNVPVLYLPEIMAIALGVELEDLDLRRRSVKPTGLIEKLTT